MEDHIGCVSFSEEKVAKKRSKSNVQCSVFGCQGRSNVGLYGLPNAKKDPVRRKKWIAALRIGKIKKYVKVCGKHFVQDDFKPKTDPRSKGKIKRLKKSAVPSQNLPKSSVQKSPSSAKKVSMKNRSVLANKRSQTHVPSTSVSPSNTVSHEDDFREECTFDFATDANIDAHESDANLENIDGSFKDASVQVNTFLKCNSGVKFIEVVSNDEAILACTGIPSFQKFEKICAAVELFCCDLNLTYGQRSYKLCIRERVLLTLMKLKTNIRMSVLRVFFNISKSYAMEIFMATITILYEILKDYISWPDRENIRENLPQVFRQYFPNTRIILDCTEVKIQKFECLICRTRTYSHYKCAHTIKILIGIAPSGLITYVSPAFGGRTSDKFIFNYDKVISKCEVGDSIMVDKGFLINDECVLAGIELIQPPFVGKQGKLSAEDCIKNNLIAKARVHVERIMQRIKIFDFLRHDMHLSYLDCIDKIVTVICALVNLSNPILSDSRF